MGKLCIGAVDQIIDLDSTAKVGDLGLRAAAKAAVDLETLAAARSHRPFHRVCPGERAA